MNESPTSIMIEADPLARRRPDRTHYVFIVAGLFVVGSLLLFYLSSPGKKPRHIPTPLEEAEGYLKWEDSGAKSIWLYKSVENLRAAGDAANAERMLDAVAKSAAGSSDADDRAEWLIKVAEEYVRLGRLEDAKAALKLAGPDARGAKYPWDQARLLTELSVALLHVGERAAGETALHEAEAVLPKVRQASTSLPVLAKLALACAEYGAAAQADKYVIQAFRTVETYYVVEERAHGGRDAAEIFFRGGRPDLGRKMFDIAFREAKSMEFQHLSRSYMMMSLIYDLEPYRDQVPLQEVKAEAIKASLQINDNPGVRSSNLKELEAMPTFN